MTETRTIRLGSGTKKALVLAIALLSVCAVGAVLVVGRGGSSGLQAASSGGAGLGAPRVSDGGGQDEGGFAQLEECLAEHGVTLPDRPGQGTLTAPSDELRQALAACRRYLPALPFRGADDGLPGDGAAPPPGTPPAGRSDEADPSF